MLAGAEPLSIPTPGSTPTKVMLASPGWTGSGDAPATLAYDGSGCDSAVSAVAFRFRLRRGTLSLVDAAGRVEWSRTDDQGDAWRPTVALVQSAAFRFALEGGAAAAAVSVRSACGAP